MGRVAFVFEGSLKALRKAAQQRLKPAGRSQVRRNCVASPARLFICRSTALRPRALRPQLKRDPLGSTHMITISVWRSFEWKTLTLRWHAKCADPALSPGVAIRRAASVLEGEYLAVKVLP